MLSICCLTGIFISPAYMRTSRLILGAQFVACNLRIQFEFWYLYWKTTMLYSFLVQGINKFKKDVFGWKAPIFKLCATLEPK